jgi:bifunctional non-homologous end joining protein LigD
MRAYGITGYDSRVTIDIQITNATRLVYPDDDISKQDIADYYAAIAGPYLRALAGRPLGLEHWQKGIKAKGFFHQHIGKEAKDWMTFAETPVRRRSQRGSSTVRHLIADRPETLRWLAQYSVLTVHMWHSRVPHLDSPDWVLFDLDPADGFAQTLDVAIALRRLLDDLGLPSIPKTSGKRGLHVFVPLAPGHGYDETLAFALAVGERLAAQLPQMTLERSLDKRQGRLYFDCLQNGQGKMVVAPYSLRAIKGAPVSAPLSWSEVGPGLDPARFNLRSMPRRIDEVGDLFAAALENGVRLPKSI